MFVVSKINNGPSYPRLFCSLFLALLLVSPILSQGAASSSNYKIQFDSINVGGKLGTSTNYRIEDTTGEIASGNASSTNYKLFAGYQQMDESSISISDGANITMSAIGGIGAQASTGSTSWTVITDNVSGYQMTIVASTSPALKSGSESFSNYTTAIAEPDYTFSIGSTVSEFGFSPEGADIPTLFKDNGSSCNAGSGDTADKCWDALTTSAKQIAYRTTSTPGGTLTTLKVRAENGADHLQMAGTYTANLTVTALTL